MQGFNNVSFICVCRLSDRTILASYSYNSTVELPLVKKILDQKMGMQPGTHYSFTTGEQSWHLMGDVEGLVYIGITANNYPARVANLFVSEISRSFTAKVGAQGLSCKENGLTKTCKGTFEKIAQKYDNLKEVDVITNVSSKVESVKLVMQNNVTLALQNCVTLESIETKAEQLQEQAGVFKKTARSVKNKMWWKNVKMWLVIAFIVLAIIGIILAVTIPRAQDAADAVDGDDR